MVPTAATLDCRPSRARPTLCWGTLFQQPVTPSSRIVRHIHRCPRGLAMPVFLRHRDGCTPMPHQEQDPTPALDYARHRRWCASCPPFAVGAERRSFDCGARRLNQCWPFAPPRPMLSILPPHSNGVLIRTVHVGAVTLRRVTTTSCASWAGLRCAVRREPPSSWSRSGMAHGSHQAAAGGWAASVHHLVCSPRRPSSLRSAKPISRMQRHQHRQGRRQQSNHDPCGHCEAGCPELVQLAEL